MLGLLRAVAGLMLFAGISLLIAIVPVWGLLSGPMALGIASTVIQTALAFIAGGATVSYLSRPRASQLLPNERMPDTGDAAPRIGGWLAMFAAALVAMPVWLIVTLQPFLDEWRVVLAFLGTLDWSGANANGSGLVLIPLAGALTPPLLELAAMIGFALTSIVGLVLLFPRRRRFPRVYLLCVVLLSSLVFAGARGAGAAGLVVDALQDNVVRTSPTASEIAQITGGLNRYTTAVNGTVPPLAWTLCGYLVWVPFLVFSSRSQRTFVQGRVGYDSTPPLDTELTSPPAGFGG